jgi:hypothetical protein
MTVLAAIIKHMRACDDVLERKIFHIDHDDKASTHRHERRILVGLSSNKDDTLTRPLADSHERL